MAGEGRIYTVALPNDLLAEIDEKLDAALAKMPEAKGERQSLRDQLIEAFLNYGRVPDFSIERNDDD